MLLNKLDRAFSIKNKSPTAVFNQFPFVALRFPPCLLHSVTVFVFGSKGWGIDPRPLGVSLRRSLSFCLNCLGKKQIQKWALAWMTATIKVWQFEYTQEHMNY